MAGTAVLGRLTWRLADVVDVARGWAYEDLTFVNRGDTETMADVGFGLMFDEVGVYGAIPITGDDQSLRVVVRLFDPDFAVRVQRGLKLPRGFQNVSALEAV